MESLSSLLKDKISVGKIVNSHGVKGEVKFQPYTNVEAVIKNLGDILLYNPNNKRFFYSKVTKVKDLNKFFILSLNGITNMDEAKKVIGYEIYIGAENLPKLNENEYYWYEILDSEVYYEDGEYVGKVSEIIETGANDVISIKNEKSDTKNQETLIPMTNYHVLQLNKKEKIIVVRKMEWYEDESE